MLDNQLESYYNATGTQEQYNKLLDEYNVIKKEYDELERKVKALEITYNSCNATYSLRKWKCNDKRAAWQAEKAKLDTLGLDVENAKKAMNDFKVEVIIPEEQKAEAAVVEEKNSSMGSIFLVVLVVAGVGGYFLFIRK